MSNRYSNSGGGSICISSISSVQNSILKIIHILIYIFVNVVIHTALLERDITRALQHPDRLNQHMNDAVEARREVRALCLFTYVCMYVMLEYTTVYNYVLSM